MNQMINLHSNYDLYDGQEKLSTSLVSRVEMRGVAGRVRVVSICTNVLHLLGKKSLPVKNNRSVGGSECGECAERR